MSCGEQDRNVFLAGVGGMVEGGRGGGLEWDGVVVVVVVMLMMKRLLGRKLEVEIVLREFRRFLVLRIFSSGRSRNFLHCRGEFVALLVRMMMMGDAGRSAGEGSEVV